MNIINAVIKLSPKIYMTRWQQYVLSMLSGKVETLSLLKSVFSSSSKGHSYLYTPDTCLPKVAILGASLGRLHTEQ